MLPYEVYIFIDAYHSQCWGKAEKTHQEIFSCVDTEEKVAVRFAGEKDQDAIYEITSVSTSI